MRNLRFLLLPFFCLTLSSSALRAQTQAAQAQPANTSPSPSTSVAVTTPDPQTPAEFFARARQLSDLEAAGIPFHLKATFAASGDAEYLGNGTYEEWWKDKNHWRKEAKLENFRYVAFKSSDGNPQLYTSSVYIPLRLRQALADVLIHVPADATAIEWKIEHKKIQKWNFITVSGEYPCQKPSKYAGSKQKCGEQNYFTAAGVLRIKVFEAATILYNQFQAFQGHLIPRSVQVVDENVKTILDISINLLEPLPAQGIADPILSAVPSDLQLAQPISRRQPPEYHSAKPSSLVRQSQPTYPNAAKFNKIQGTVVIRATIDSEGNVREPYVIHSVGPLLDNSALTAVRQWKYLPTMVDGKPVAVETTISVVYSIW